MTSSLVGSEMCIRDSLDPLDLGTALALALAFDLEGDASTTGRADGPVAVSYTHLTLPTICSV
eukprot:11612023-Prorocentrum_lima.AAC.1